MESINLFNKLQAQFEKERMDVKKIDIQIALEMSHHFSEVQIFEAIKNYSHRSDDDSTKAGPYARTIIKNIKESFEKIRTKAKATGTKTKKPTDRTTDGLVSAFVKTGGISRVNFFT